MSNLSPQALTERRERVFIALAAVFLSAMFCSMSLGITKFIQLGPMALAVGVLPYPLTFLCTDLISELYGKARANYLVTVGLFINGFILLVMTIGEFAPSVDPSTMPPWQTLPLAGPVGLPSGKRSAVKWACSLCSMPPHRVLSRRQCWPTSQHNTATYIYFTFWKRVTGASIFGFAITSAPSSANSSIR